MDAVGLYQVGTVGKQRVQVDNLQSVLPGHFLLNGDDVVHNHRVADVPSALEGRDGGAQEDARLRDSRCLRLLSLFLALCCQLRSQRLNHLLQVLLEFSAMLPVVRLRVVGAQFDDDDVGLEGQRIFPSRFVHIGEVTLLEHGAGTYSEVLHPVAVAQFLLQQGGIAVLWGHVDAVAVGNAVADASHANGIRLRCLTGLQPCTQFVQHLVVILEPGAESEPVVAAGIDEHAALVAGIAHGRIIGDTIGDGRHQPVVVGHDDNCRRGEVALHGILR